jgi:hypothetical protein
MVVLRTMPTSQNRDMGHPELWRDGLCCRDDLADEGLEFGWGRCDLQGFAKHGFGFVQELRVFREEGDEGLVGFEPIA